DPQWCALAGALPAEQPEHLPGVTDQIDAIHDQTPAQTLDERTRFEQRRHARHCTDSLALLGVTQDVLSNLGRLVNDATARRLMVAPAAFDQATLAIHVLRPHPVRERVVGPVLAPPFRRRVETSVHAEEVFAPAAIRGVRVEDLAGVVSEK